MAERFEKFSLAISELYQYLHKITREEMEEYGLNGPHAIYFFILARHENGLTCSELSEASFRDKADVSRAMALFEKKGLVKKVAGKAGGYRAKIVLTEIGMDAARKLRERAIIVSDLVDKGMTDQRRDALYSTLALLALNMREICNDKT